VNSIIADGVPVSLSIGLAAIAIAVAVGTIAGLVGALRPGSLADAATQLVAVIGISVPSFVTGAVLLVVFAAKLGWAPIGGWSGLRSMVLPACALSLPFAAYVARLMRSSMIEQMSADYVRTARAKGLAEKVVVVKHALRNAAVPIVTLGALEFGQLLSGAVLTEQVFTIPGFGKLIVDAVFNRDYLVVQGVVLVTATVYVSLNLLADVAYILLNPRLR
jgi:peptide/nickel transport system permease protein